MRKLCTFVLSAAASVSVVLTASAAPLTPIEELGKQLFFDEGLSNPPGQSCASCHDPAVGWTGPNSAINAAGAVEQGALPTRFGNRKPPMSAYAGYNPVLAWHGGGMGGGGMGGGGMGGGGMGGGGMGGMIPSFVGGLFWDGRATGWTLGDPLAEQAMGPFLNPLEMNNPNERAVCTKVRGSEYAGLFLGVWGNGSLNCAKDPKGVYKRIAQSIAAYERSGEVNPFSSKFDRFWDAAKSVRPPVMMINMMNKDRFRNLGLNDMELIGLAVFNSKGNCTRCHFLQPMNGSPYPLLTDFRYHNLGIPKNPLNPFYDMPRRWNPDGDAWVDPGIAGFLAKVPQYADKVQESLGKHRTPSLRNVDKRMDAGFVKAFGHNGYFKSLMHIIHFYNVRDVDQDCSISSSMGMPCIEPPEVPQNVSQELGDLKLTQQEGMALLQFLKTLSDE